MSLLSPKSIDALWSYKPSNFKERIFNKIPLQILVKLSSPDRGGFLTVYMTCIDLAHPTRYTTEYLTHPRLAFILGEMTQWEIIFSGFYPTVNTPIENLGYWYFSGKEGSTL